MRATLRRSPTPLALRSIEILARQATGTLRSSAFEAARSIRQRALFVLVNVMVAAIVVALPFLVATGPGAAQASATHLAIADASLADANDARDVGTPVARAQSPSRGGTISAGRNPVTVQAAGEAAIVHRTLTKDDSLWTMANFYGLTAEAIASSNGITDPYHLQIGQDILIPPAEGALYTVAPGDTVETVAAKFKVDPETIRSHNRLYFEPERFAAGKIVFVPNAELATLPRPEEPAQPTVIARAAPVAPSARSGFLAWPTGGRITQYFWWGHTGVDIAAPYGTGLAASVSGTISQNGWVAVGGLHICVKSGNLEECYYHLSAAYLAVGTPVAAGQIVAAIGLTGVTTGPHVHWETKVNGQFVNPLAVLP